MYPYPVRAATTILPLRGKKKKVKQFSESQDCCWLVWAKDAVRRSTVAGVAEKRSTIINTNSVLDCIIDSG